MRRFEYRVCMVQSSRVTFVNGTWQGHTPPDAVRSQESLDSCPLCWDYLAEAGSDGWELVAAVDSAYETPKSADHFRELYLRRELDPA